MSGRSGRPVDNIWHSFRKSVEGGKVKPNANNVIFCNYKHAGLDIKLLYPVAHWASILKKVLTPKKVTGPNLFIKNSFL